MLLSANQPLLSYDSIQRIRQYVEMKFSHLPKEKHADIVADAIVKVVEKQLPSFDYDTKKSITNEIINNVVVNKQRPIQLSDILQVVEKHPLSAAEEAQFNSWKRSITTELSAYADTKEQEAKIETASHSAAIDKKLNYVSETAASLEADTHNILKHSNSSEALAKMNNPKRKLSILFSIAFVALLSLILFSQTIFQKPFAQGTEFVSSQLIEESTSLPLNLPENELPAKYQYVDFDKNIIKSYLNTRHSLLADEPYFSAIYNTARDFNIHPVLLFAITGQEQGFVPRNHELADKIVQNPFNVFYSWQDYNTNIEDTTAIAARTLITLSKDRPEDIEAIKWINRKYAEDENWHKGVVWFYNTIVNYQTNK